MNYGRSIAVALLVAAAGPAHGAGIGVRAGSTGVGADFGWEIAPTLGGRIGFSGMKWNTHYDTDDVRYDAKVKLANFNAFLDWSPFGPFRITGGLIPNGNKVDVTGQHQFGTLTGTIKAEHSVAPYLGVGYGNVWTKGVNFYFDLGIMFQGSPKASLSLACGAAATPAQCAQAQNDVAAEQRELEEKLKKYKYFPVLGLGLTLGF